MDSPSNSEPQPYSQIHSRILWTAHHCNQPFKNVDIAGKQAQGVLDLVGRPFGELPVHLHEPAVEHPVPVYPSPVPLEVSGYDGLGGLSSGEKGGSVLKWIGGLLLAAALVFDVRTIFLHLQNAETGEFDATGFLNVNWGLVAIVSAVAVIAAIALFLIPSGKKDRA